MNFGKKVRGNLTLWFWSVDLDFQWNYSTYSYWAKHGQAWKQNELSFYSQWLILSSALSKEPFISHSGVLFLSYLLPWLSPYCCTEATWMKLNTYKSMTSFMNDPQAFAQAQADVLSRAKACSIPSVMSLPRRCDGGSYKSYYLKTSNRLKNHPFNKCFKI